MAVLINGSRIDWEAYEYGVEGPDGSISKVSSFEVMQDTHTITGQPMKFRAVYVTEWWDGTDA